MRLVRWLYGEHRLTGWRHALAFFRVPKHLFVEPDQVAHAYGPGTFPTESGQTISGADHVALMTGLLRVRPGDAVLEVGTGTGYQAAILAAMGARVTTVEIRRGLWRRAKNNLQRAGLRQVDARCGDGARGAPDRAPFRGIVLGCVPREIPQTLLDQLAIGGRLVGPEGDPSRIQRLLCIERTADGFRREVIRGTWFVPMVHEVEDA